MTRPSPPRAPHLALVITDLDYGGAERQLLDLARGFRRRGWQVDVASLIEPLAFTEELAAVGVEVRSLGMKRGVPDPRGMLRLAAWLREKRPSVVHAHMAHANFLARATRILAPVPLLITTAHNTIEGGRGVEYAYRFTDRLADVTTNVSAVAVARYRERRLAPPDRIFYMPNGVDLATFERDESLRGAVRAELGVPDEFMWLAVGRFDPVKDYRSMLTAWGEVSREAHGTLVIAGDGEERAEMEGLAATMGIEERVRFLGIRSDISRLMSAADSFLLSSKWEGLPIVLLEAAGTALPIVAPDVGGVGEVVKDGVTGYLVPAQDNAALVAAMRRMLGLSQAERRQLGANSRANVVAQFDIENVLDRWEAVYRAGLEQNGGRPHRWGKADAAALAAAGQGT